MDAGTRSAANATSSSWELPASPDVSATMAISASVDAGTPMARPVAVDADRGWVDNLPAINVHTDGAVSVHDGDGDRARVAFDADPAAAWHSWVTSLPSGKPRHLTKRLRMARSTYRAILLTSPAPSSLRAIPTGATRVLPASVDEGTTMAIRYITGLTHGGPSDAGGVVNKPHAVALVETPAISLDVLASLDEGATLAQDEGATKAISTSPDEDAPRAIPTSMDEGATLTIPASVDEGATMAQSPNLM